MKTGDWTSQLVKSRRARWDLLRYMVCGCLLLGVRASASVPGSHDLEATPSAATSPLRESASIRSSMPRCRPTLPFATSRGSRPPRRLFRPATARSSRWSI